jgi:signal transduction histidine kinase
MSASVDRVLLDPVRLLAGHELILAATLELALAADLPTVVSIAQSTASRLSGADGTTFAQREGDECHYLGIESDPDELLANRWHDLRLPLGECLSGWSMQHRQPGVVGELEADPRLPARFREAGIRSSVVVPVCSAALVAAIGTYWAQPHESDATEVRLLQSLADSVAVALDGLCLRQRLEAQANAQTAELANLSYSVSHDLRAPIRHLEGFARILLQDVAELSPDTRHVAQRIQEAATHLREMVNGMLTLSRIGQTEIHPQPMDLAQLGREAALALANAPAPADGPGRAGVVEFVTPESLPVIGDPRLLLTVLQALLGNAWKFTSRVPHPRVELGVLDGEPTTGPGKVYFVRDNGAGFEPTATDRLFGMFQRLHSGEDFPGTGVGLAAVKRIVTKHGGTVRATGTPDAGATFFFTLPDQSAR